MSGSSCVPRIRGLCDPWCLGDPHKTFIFRGLTAAVNHHIIAASVVVRLALGKVLDGLLPKSYLF